MKRSIEDVQQLVAADDKTETELVSMENLPLIVIESANKTNKLKLLNKTINILNKNFEKDKEPCLSLPELNKDANGKTEIFAEIINFDDIKVEDSDPINAIPVETNVFPCSLCERSFPLLQLRDIHMKSHSRDRKFQCKICVKSYFSKYDLNRHLHTHDGGRPYKCAVCEKDFSRSSLLRAHEKKHVEVPKFICVHCERPFISKTDMEKHANKHKIPRPFMCKICNKGFAAKQGLEKHEVIHSRQQPFSCHYCEQSFSNQTKLARHLTAHAGERPYPCKYCKKSYFYSHQLRQHVRSHKNIDDTVAFSFMCAQCNTRLTSREELISHTSTHANELNPTCYLCKDVFNTIIELNSHIEQHANGKTFACEFCDFIFASADKLQSHTDLDHSHEMKAYYADDRAGVHKQIKDLNHQENNVDYADEKFKDNINKFLEEEQTYEENDSQNFSKTDISGDELDSKYADPIEINECDSQHFLMGNIKEEHSDSDTFSCEFCDLIFMTENKLQSHKVLDHAEEMEGYYANNSVQVDEQMEYLKNEQNYIDIADEKFRDTLNEYLK